MRINRKFWEMAADAMLGLDARKGAVEYMPEFWDQDHPVLQVLRQRRQTQSQPGQRDPGDDAIVGLAAEGGGMRGVVSAAMLAGLEDRGLSQAFDAVYGCSSGAVNAAYFLTGNTWYPASIYYDDLTTREFLSYRRGILGGNVLNLDFAYNIVVDQVKPLNYEKVMSSAVKLTIGITLVDELRTLPASDFESAADLKAALIASAWLPLGVRGTTRYRGKRAIDGGVLTALPFRLAIADGCTHILSFSTKPMLPIKAKISPLGKYTVRHLNRLKPGLGDGYLAALEQKYQDQRHFADLRLTPGADRPYILDLAPLPGTVETRRNEMNPSRLFKAARNAYAVLYAAIERMPSSAVMDGQVQAIPRLTIVERDHDAGDPRFIDHVVARDAR